jgi:hypothetical protein
MSELRAACCRWLQVVAPLADCEPTWRNRLLIGRGLPQESNVLAQLPPLHATIPSVTAPVG